MKYVVPSIEDFKMDSYLQAPHLRVYTTIYVREAASGKSLSQL